MKKLFFGFLVSMMLAPVCFARPMKPVLSPNLYACKSQDNKIELTYQTSGKLGEPSLTYVRQVGEKGEVGPLGRNVSVSGTESIVVERTIVGSLVSVRDERLRAVREDIPSEWISLVLPDVTLGLDAKPLDFSTLVLETTVQTPFFHPPFGAVQSSASFSVTCRAASVRF
ncbi:MAG: hypothetical protein HYY62_08180 [Deltaproteobacteria bacterium]|nr:hypothetical protein [Deltaproteobacteria bacterium]